MVKNIVNAIVEQMEKENLLNIEMKEYFTYSIAMIIEKWITIISVLFVGGIFKQTVQMMLFLFFFLLLRKRTGGYHASSFLQFEDGALTAIAEKAMEKDTGARALRAIIEKFMLDIMYEIPKDDNIGRVTITEDYIRNNGAPLIEMRPYLQLEQKKREIAAAEEQKEN